MGLGKNCLAATNPFAWPVIAGVILAVTIKNLDSGITDFWNVAGKMLWED